MLPSFLYGTAWKEEETERLTRLALDAGFRGVDTANQRKHYFEAGAGAAIANAIADGVLQRDELFIQTKFTFRDGQDHRLPYDPDAPMAAQVQQSFASSLEHLQVASLDSYVLHGPSRRRGLGRADREAWRAMEELHGAGTTRFLGISNVALDQLEELFEFAQVRPAFVQNRCYARTGWDSGVRAFCRANDVTYQGFSLLTANAAELRSAAFRNIVKRTGKTPAQVVFAFARQVGMLPLTGTTDVEHMREDLASTDFDLSSDDIEQLESLAPAR
ncbi:MAG TPA: aldo/keto reductase [Thermoanaerobaculia bacterium]|nr:aldo/keto reductase [Thermoanaerobaculia bacterium]